MLCTKVSEFIGETTNALCNFTSTIKKNFSQSMHVDLSNQLQPVLHLYAQR